MVSKFLRHPQAQYKLKHRQGQRKGFTAHLELHAVNPVNPAKVDKKIKPPAIGSHDLVLAVLDDPESDEIEQRHMLCVVGFIGENVVTLKNALMPADSRIDQRNYNMLLFTGKKDSKWTLLKICSLENFNRSYAGFDAF